MDAKQNSKINVRYLYKIRVFSVLNCSLSVFVLKDCENDSNKFFPAKNQTKKQKVVLFNPVFEVFMLLFPVQGYYY